MVFHLGQYWTRCLRYSQISLRAKASNRQLKARDFVPSYFDIWGTGILVCACESLDEVYHIASPNQAKLPGNPKSRNTWARYPTASAEKIAIEPANKVVSSFWSPCQYSKRAAHTNLQVALPSLDRSSEHGRKSPLLYTISGRALLSHPTWTSGCHSTGLIVTTWFRPRIGQLSHCHIVPVLSQDQTTSTRVHGTSNPSTMEELLVSFERIMSIDTSEAAKDAVIELFENLPCPEDDFYPSFNNVYNGETPAARQYHSALSQLQETSAQGVTSSDPDFDFLLDKAKESLAMDSITHFCTQLAHLAREKQAASTNEANDLKNRHLEYYRWIVEGRKDETSPFLEASASASPKSTATPVSHAFLPSCSTYKKCATCGKDGATSRCSGCRVSIGSQTTFETLYCDKNCQIIDWKHHKGLCTK